MGVLDGVRIVEIAGLGPGPFCGMLLADLGADVVVVERTRAAGDPTDMGPAAIVNRGKRSLALDLKSPEAVEIVLRLVERADGLIEGMRPGVMERIGLGPETCLARNPRLVYGRMTGWGQSGPLASAVGHDLNYAGVSGALWLASPPGQPPFPPPTLVGDIGGGALYLAVGLLGGILRARAGFPGQVVDAAIVDGAAHLQNLLLSLRGAGLLPAERGRGLLDGAPFSRCYRCADGKFVTVQPIEPRFYAVLLEKIGAADDAVLAGQFDVDRWPAMNARLEAVFATRTRDAWCALLEGTDACVAPVLDPDEAASHPHNVARGTFASPEGFLQGAPAPRFSRDPGTAGRIPDRGEHGADLLREIGYGGEKVERLVAAGAVALPGA